MGLFFQTVHVPVVQRSFDSTATISVDGAPLVPWVDFLPRDPGLTPIPLDGVQVVYGGVWTDSNSVISTTDARGKFVVITSTRCSIPQNPPGIPSRQDVAQHFRMSAGIAVVGLENFPPATLANYRQPGVGEHRDGARRRPTCISRSRRPSASSALRFPVQRAAWRERR